MSSHAENLATAKALEESQLERGTILFEKAINSAATAEEIGAIQTELADLMDKAEAKKATLAQPAAQNIDFANKGRLFKLAPLPEAANDNTLDEYLKAAFPGKTRGSIRRMLNLALAPAPPEREYQKLEAGIRPDMTDKEAKRAVAGIFKLAKREGSNPNDPKSWSQRLQKIADGLYKSDEPVELQVDEAALGMTLYNEIDWFQGETPENLVNFSIPADR